MALRERELAQARAERDELLDASIEMRVQAEAGRSSELASRAKSEFLATISHEIRTPLHGILGNADLLLGSALDDEQRRCVEMLRTSARALTTILDDVLDLSKIESGRLALHREPFDLCACVRQAGALFASVAQDKGLRFELSVPDGLPRAVLGDASRLRQVLLNLLSNAVKFTPSGSVTLRLDVADNGPSLQAVSSAASTPAPRPGQALTTRIAVTDTGIGIPADRVGQLFQSFQQVDASMSRRYGGTGLGLAISQRLVGLMGGVIGVDTGTGRGSTFHFTLRWEVTDPELVATGSTQAGGGAQASAPVQPLRLLLVEDNPVNQAVALGMLARLGHTAAVATDGAAAVVAQRDHGYDLVLMDIQMPGLDGVEATRRIRALQGIRQPRIVALTANAAQADRRAYLEAGMDDHLAKPFELHDLDAVIARATAAAGREEAGAAALPPDAGPPPFANAASPTSTAADPAVLDESVRESLRRQFGAGFLARVDEAYLRSSGPLVQEMHDACAVGDAQHLRDAAHSLKSASSQVGALRMSTLCGRLEALAREGRSDLAANLVQAALGAEWEALSQALAPST